MKKYIFIGFFWAVVFFAGTATAFAATPYAWTPQTLSGSQSWTAIASSSDGTHLAAVAGNVVSVSINSGASWTTHTVDLSGENWVSITSNADGSKLAAVSSRSGHDDGLGGIIWVGGDIWTSIDGGASWTNRYAAGFNGGMIASDGSGQYLAAVDSNTPGLIYASSDYGATWGTGGSFSTSWKAIAVSGDGGTIIAGRGNSGIYKSTNHGGSYTSLGFADCWSAFAVSETGQHIVSASDSNGCSGTGGYMRISHDYGSTWAQLTSAGLRTWIGVTVSSDGTVVSAADRGNDISVGGYIWTTSNATAASDLISWTQETNPGIHNWYDIAASSDGTKIAAVPSNTVNGDTRYVYTAVPVVAPLVTTVAASSIDSTTATINGNLTSLGGSDLSVSPNISLKFLYGTVASGAYAAVTHSATVTATGIFSQNITGLQCGTAYQFKAVATNSAGTTTAGDLLFTTLVSCPTVAYSWETHSNGYVKDVASSADGQYLAFVNRVSSTDGYISTTYNGNPSAWIAETSPGSSSAWWGIASSADGLKLVAARFIAGSGTPSALYTGVATESLGARTFSWTERTVAAAGALAGWYAVASSADGQYMAAAANTADGNNLFMSSDGGANWTLRLDDVRYDNSGITNSINTMIMMSSTGQYLAVLGADGYVHTSEDFGVTWTQQTATAGFTFTTLAASSDGTKIYGTNGGSSGVFLSSDSGVTWATIPGTAGVYHFSTLASSSDGLRLAAANSDGYIYTSMNGGLSWNQETTLGVTPTVSKIAFSSDGSYIVVGGVDHFYTAVPVVAPTVTTTSSGSLTPSGATLTGNLTALGGNSIPNAVSFDYDLGSSGATYASNSSSDTVSTTGTFTATLTGLACNTAYHYRAKTVNAVDTATGTDMTFTTNACTAPAVTTSAASSITASSATLNGTITDTGGESVTERGFHYGTTSSYGTNLSETGTFSAGAFTGALTGLVCGTVYHYESYALNVTGTGTSSPDATFTTSACVSSGGGGGGGGGASLSVVTPSSFTISEVTPIATPATTTTPIYVFYSPLSGTISYGGLCKGVLTTTTAGMNKIVFLPLAPGAYTNCTIQVTAPGSISNILSVKSFTVAPRALPTPGIIPPASSSFFFSKNLNPGVTDPSVLQLQKYLNAQGFIIAKAGSGSPGNETKFFGPATRAALTKFQEAHIKEILLPVGLTNGTGTLGNSTRKFINTYSL